MKRLQHIKTRAWHWFVGLPEGVHYATLGVGVLLVYLGAVFVVTFGCVLLGVLP